MSRRMIYTLSLVMAIATAAMIWVQMMTINHMSGLQKYNFDSQVNRTLDEVVDYIDQAEVKQYYESEAQQSVTDFSSPLDFYPNTDPAGSLRRLGQSGELTIISKFSGRNIQSGIREQSKSPSVQISSMQTYFEKKTYDNVRRLNFYRGGFTLF